jgi:toxin CptA
MTSAPAIGFEYQPSRWPGRVFLWVTTLAVLAVWLSAIPFWLKGVLIACAVLAAWRAIARLAHPVVKAAGWTRDGGWSLRMVAGEDMPATVISSRVAGDRVVWLHLATPKQGPISLLLAPDNSDADIRRRLRMRLALAASGGPQTPGGGRGTLSPERGPTV